MAEIGDYTKLLKTYPTLVVSVTELIQYLKANGLKKESQVSIANLEEWMSIRVRISNSLNDNIKLKRAYEKQQLMKASERDERVTEQTGPIIYSDKFKKDLQVLLDSLSSLLLIKNNTLHELINATVQPLGIAVVTKKKYFIVAYKDLVLIPHGLADKILSSGLLL